MRPLHRTLLLLLLAVVIAVVLEALGIREEARRWSAEGLSETYCEPNAYCRTFQFVAMGVLVVAGALLLHRTAKSRAVKALDIIAGVFMILVFAGMVYAEFFARG